jgi:hypothetical protein
MFKRAIPGLLTLAVLLGPASAQMARAPMRFSTSRGFGRATEHARFPRSVYLGTPLWLDDYAAPYEPASPPIIVLQAPSPATQRTSAPIEEHKSADPLLIEWQGDRYVRRSSVAANNPRAGQPDYVADQKQSADTKSSDTVASSKSEPPPATFIFRDGHHEESADYSIISGVIYARGDYWTTGYWSKQIPLAQLDLPATLKANQDRGVPFRLPTAPNEVVTRP